MATDRAHDFEVDGLGFMLARAEGRGRAWRRTGVVDAPSRRNINDTTYGNVPDTLDHPEVWNDWSGGFGDAYEVPERPNTYHWARGFDLRFPRQAIHAQAPQLLAARYASFNQRVNFFIDVPLALGAGAQQGPGQGQVILLGPHNPGNQIGVLTPTHFQNTAGSAFDLRLEGSSNIFNQLNFPLGNRAAIFGSHTFLPNLANSAFWRRDNDTATYTLGLVPARWFQTAAGRLWWTLDGQNLISVGPGANAMATANYAATITLDGVSRDAISIDDELMVGVPQGVLAGNITGTFNNIADDLGTLIDVDNCRDLTAFQGGLSFAQGPHIWWYKPSTGGQSELREVGPSGLFANRSAIRGKFTCVKGNGRWLYAGLFTGSGSYFMVGRDASYPLPYVWHPLHDFLGLNCKVHRIHVDGITVASNRTTIPNRIWCATEGSYGSQAGATAPVFWWPIPYGDNNPLGDVTFSPNYMGSARLDMPASEWVAPGTPKVWRSAETWAEGVASGAQYADLYYHLDNGARATLGRAQTLPKDTRYFSSGEGSFVTGQALGLSVDSFTASINTTPVYRAFVVRGALEPGSIDVIEARTRIADDMRNRRGTPMRPGAAMLKQLRDRANGSAPSILTDLTGARSWVKVQAPVEEEEFYQVGDENPEVMALVRMSVLTFSGPP